jgi:TonB-linked SusC/RagA family outer membrane protein
LLRGALVLLLAMGLAPSLASAQARGTIQGAVVDEAGDPIPNASVLVVGSNTGTLTRADGRFLLTGLPAGEAVTLRVTVLGYRSATREVDVGSTVEFVLSASAINLDQIVVTGTATGQQVRRAVGNSITDIDVEETVEVAPVKSVSDLLNGRSPGVVVNTGSGQVGGGPTVRIRGASSFSLNTQPLIYVDGVRIDNAMGSGISIQGFGSGIVNRMNDIDPEDIESIEIIKGPAAATLYGTEASNGVIQIITKKGRIGTSQINVQMRQGANWFRNADERIEENWGIDPETGEIYAMNLFELEEQRGNPPIFETGHLQGYSVNLRGGTEQVRYYLSGSLDDDDGIEPDNTLRQVGARANLTVAPSDQFDVTGSFGVTTGRVGLACEAGCGGRMWATLYAVPSWRDTEFRGFRSYPPEVITEAWDFWQDIYRSQLSIQFNHRPTTWLSHRLTVGQDRVEEDNEELAERMGDEFAPFFGASTRRGWKWRQDRNVATTTVDYSATASFGITRGINSSTTVGAQYFHKDTELTAAWGREFPAAGLRVIDAMAQTFGGDWLVENKTFGLFVQEQIALNDRLFLTGAVRGDDNSAFGVDYDFVLYPKASLSWVVSDEDFWTFPVVDALKLRLAYGESGQQPDEFAALRRYQPVTGGDGTAAVTPQFVGNADLGPEVGKEFEAGFEAGLLESRIGIDFTYYNTHTFDAILLREVPPSTGFPGSMFVNAGEIANSGVEMQLNALAFRRENVSVDLQLNLATNDNEVVDLGGIDQGVGFIAAGSQRRVPGFPVASWFRRKVVSADLQGTGRNAVATNVMCDGGDPNGATLPDGTPLELGGPAVPCSEAPRLYLGTAIPTFEGSFGTTITLWKNLQLYGMVDWKTGHKKFDNDTRIRCQIFNACHENFFPEEYDAGLIAQMQSPGTLVDFIINDASYAKLRELSARLTLPNRIANLLRAAGGSISVAGRNLAIFSPWTSLDPEGGFNEFGYTFLEQDNTPQLTSFVTTVSLTY